MHRIAALALLITALAACAVTPEPPAPPPVDELLADLKVEMYAYLAMERARLNEAAPPLQLDPLLEEAAQAHSDAMAERRAFDEGDSDTNVAIRHLAADPVFQGYVAESSGMRYFDPQYGFDPTAYAHAIIDQWIAIEEHRRNIEYTNFVRVGVGVAANGNEIYASQIMSTAIIPPAD